MGDSTICYKKSMNNINEKNLKSIEINLFWNPFIEKNFSSYLKNSFSS